MANRRAFGIRTLKQYPKALNVARATAEKHGYAIGLHGSRTYDLDLIAAPWADQCSEPDALAIAIACALGWYLHNLDLSGKAHATPKPHGRKCYLIYGKRHAHIDLSVMPKVNEGKC